MGIGLKIHHFISYCNAPNFCDIVIYSIKQSEDVYSGPLNEVPDEYRDCEIKMIDPVNQDMPFICINID